MKEYIKPTFTILLIADDVICESGIFGNENVDDNFHWPD